MIQGRKSGAVFVWLQIAAKTHKVGFTIQIGRAVNMVLPCSSSVTTQCADVSSFHPYCSYSVLCVSVHMDGLNSATTNKGIHCRPLLGGAAFSKQIRATTNCTYFGDI